MPYPKGKPRTDNSIAIMKAAWKPRPKIRPEKGTDDYRLFRKIEKTLNAAAAHAELRRGV